MITAVNHTHYDVVPGASVRVDIDVTNTAAVIDGITVLVDGLDPGWVNQVEPVLSLFPGDRGVVSFDIAAPDDARAGNYLVVVQVASTVDTERERRHDFWVSVASVERATATIIPTVITTGSKATAEITLKNTGNTTTTYRLTALDAARQIDFSAEPPLVMLHPGQARSAQLTIRGDRPWFGNTATRLVQVTAASKQFKTEPLEVTFNQRARVPRGLMTFVILAGIVALWAVIFWYVIHKIGDDEALEKKLATDFATGELDIPIEKIAGSVSGTVFSATEREGLPRISVQASRKRELDLLLVSEAATDEEGNFMLDGLIPGTYVLEFSRDGFTSTTRDVKVETDGPVETRESGRAQDSLNAELNGTAGVVAGIVETGSDGTEKLVFNVAYQLVDDADAATGNVTASGALLRTDSGQIDPVVEPVIKSVGTDPAGRFEIPGLATPATYVLTVTAADFAPLRYEVRVEGGETVQPNPVRPIAALGTISGSLIDAAGASLGGVSVRVSNGDFVTETITPTGDTAEFFISGLETPAEYVVTFFKEGYTRSSVSLPLAAGEQNDQLQNVQLVGGLGRVSGSVVDGGADQGTDAALGAVEITVQGNGFLATSSSLTTASSNGGGLGRGSFVVSGLPVPGSYAVTYRLDGYESQTLPVAFGERADPQMLPPVRLERTNGQISGVIGLSAASETQPITDLDVTLDDGEVVRTTAIATTPAGFFEFDDLPPGSYTITVRDGDETLWVMFRRLTVGQTRDASAVIARLPAGAGILSVAPFVTARSLMTVTPI